MTSTVIFKIDSKLKSQAQKTAGELGLTLTSILKGYLKDFVQNKSISFRDPYGLLPGEPITEKEIKRASLDWQKAIQKIG